MIVSEVEGADWQTGTCREHSGSPHGAQMLRAGELCVDGEHCLTQHGDGPHLGSAPRPQKGLMWLGERREERPRYFQPMLPCVPATALREISNNWEESPTVAAPSTLKLLRASGWEL